MDIEFLRIFARLWPELIVLLTRDLDRFEINEEEAFNFQIRKRSA